ncbi:TCR/Tet family MFS transporter [Terriglobus sp. ADX1]|uniref:TCR/Tet family MFS transporter n=1 Tax=Terriglobus sp. ADX1 TaxID=2794063 RepID=UPI002FE5BBFA
MARARLLILFVVVLDAMGIGIVFPTLPELLRTLMHGSGDPARAYGYLLSAYALSMFFASPVLGALSDRFGRRPVLLFSLLGTAFDDLMMGLAPTLWILYAARTLAGFSGANLTVTNAYLADITPEEERSGAFGKMNACFGVGFIAGPVLGGIAGMYSLRAPFYLAAALNIVGAVLAVFVLPESRKVTEAKRITLGQLNPFASLRNVFRLRGIGAMLYVFCTMDMVGQVPSVLWVIYGNSRFGWTPFMVGVSFALFGLLHAVFQSILPERFQRWVGERGSILAGIAADTTGYALYSIASTTVAALSILPLLCLGGIALPSVQSMLSRSVDESRQGELQGVLTSLNSLIAVGGPVVASSLYSVARTRIPQYPGAIWLAPVLLYVPCVAMLLWKASERKLAEV